MQATDVDALVALARTLGTLGAAVLLVTYLGLLFWETRYVSASLAFPGLKPRTKGA